MNFCNIKYCDIADGYGVRTSLFVSGCTNHCEQCFQPQTWDFDYGEPFTKETEDKIIESLRPHYINGLTLLGYSDDIQRLVIGLILIASLTVKTFMSPLSKKEEVAK